MVFNTQHFSLYRNWRSVGMCIFSLWFSQLAMLTNFLKFLNKPKNSTLDVGFSQPPHLIEFKLIVVPSQRANQGVWGLVWGFWQLPSVSHVERCREGGKFFSLRGPSLCRVIWVWECLSFYGDAMLWPAVLELLPILVPSNFSSHLTENYSDWQFLQQSYKPTKT